MYAASLIIGHAGCGTIIDALRHKKPMIAVSKYSLYFYLQLTDQLQSTSQ